MKRTASQIATIGVVMGADTNGATPRVTARVLEKD